MPLMVEDAVNSSLLVSMRTVKAHKVCSSELYYCVVQESNQQVPEDITMLHLWFMFQIHACMYTGTRNTDT